MSDELGFRREMGEEVQADLMMPSTGIFEEVFSDAQELPALDDLIQLLLQLSNDGRRRVFPKFDATARQCPELILYRSVQEDFAMMFSHRSGSELEARAIQVEGNHTL